MIKSSNDYTPFSLTYGTEAVIPAEIGMLTYRTTVLDVVHNNEKLRLNLDLLKERRERAAIHEAKAKLKMTKYYNTRAKDRKIVHGIMVIDDYIHNPKNKCQLADCYFAINLGLVAKKHRIWSRTSHWLKYLFDDNVQYSESQGWRKAH
nr:reverse transcriptase domain-containing protein [Tanacetum cinerariifolium]